MTPVSLPRLTILQATSPLLKPRCKQYVKGATAGMISDGRRLWDPLEGISLLLILEQETYQQWCPRKGFIKNWGADRSVTDFAKNRNTDSCHPEKNQWLMFDGSEIVPTHEFFAYLVDEKDLSRFEQVLISMPTKIWSKGGVSIYWDSDLLHFSTRVERHSENGNWFGWNILRHNLSMKTSPALVEAEFIKKVHREGKFTFPIEEAAAPPAER
jgi:hypothetical protein